jgi:hypothetical protein
MWSRAVRNQALPDRFTRLLRCRATALYERPIMKRFGYWLSVGLLIAGAAAAVAELLTIVQGAPSTLSLGAIWFRIHANSLVGFQAAIEKQLTPLIWPPIQWLLTLPTWLVLVPPGLLLVFLCRDKGRG